MFWSNTISNDLMLREADMTALSTATERGRWLWIGHIMRMTNESLPRLGLMEGFHMRRITEAWRSTPEKMLVNKGWTWETAKKLKGGRGGGGKRRRENEN